MNASSMSSSSSLDVYKFLLNIKDTTYSSLTCMPIYWMRMNGNVFYEDEMKNYENKNKEEKSKVKEWNVELRIEMLWLWSFFNAFTLYCTALSCCVCNESRQRSANPAFVYYESNSSIHQSSLCCTGIIVWLVSWMMAHWLEPLLIPLQGGCGEAKNAAIQLNINQS